MIGLAAEIPIFQPTLAAFLRGDPEALLVVEFAEATTKTAGGFRA